jgi:hypothetical protein
VDPLFEYKVARNSMLGATSLWQFCRSYYDETRQNEAPPLPKVILVLPLVLHRESVVNIKARRKEGGLYKILAEDRDFSLGLQERIAQLSALTLQSLAIACASSLLSVELQPDWPRYQPIPKTMPQRLKPTNEDVRGVIDASRRLGIWFAQEGTPSLCSLLEISL